MNTSIKNAINVSTLESIKEAMEKIEEKKYSSSLIMRFGKVLRKPRSLRQFKKVWIRLAIYLKKENTELRI